MILAGFGLGHSVGRSHGSRRRVAVDTVRHQRMRRVEDAFDSRKTIALFALGNELLRIGQVVQDAIGPRPLSKQMIVLEKMVVAKRRVRDHQGLHRHRVFLHDVRNAGIGIDHQFVGQCLSTFAIEHFFAGKFLSKGPVRIHQRHADCRVRIEHLFAGNDLDLIAIDAQSKLAQRDLFNRIMSAAEKVKVPLGTAVD